METMFEKKSWISADVLPQYLIFFAGEPSILWHHLIMMKKTQVVGLTSRCHLSNMMPDDIFYESLEWGVA